VKWTTALAVIIVVILIAAGGIFAYLNYGSGSLQILVSDPSINWEDATQVYLNYSAIEVHRADAGNDSGWFTVIDSSGLINLTRILDINQTIGSKSLQAGTYNLVRFTILDANVTVSGENYTATVPSGKLQIAITQGGIRVNTGQTSSLLIELNIAVIAQTSGGYKIVPAIRATPT
jgi:hypothetical protein